VKGCGPGRQLARETGNAALGDLGLGREARNVIRSHLPMRNFKCIFIFIFLFFCDMVFKIINKLKINYNNFKNYITIKTKRIPKKTLISLYQYSLYTTPFSYKKCLLF
jgi:hypothetical protein